MDLGSSVSLRLGAGKVVERYEYGDYGVPTIFADEAHPDVLAGTINEGDMVATSAIGNPYLFNGRRFDAESGFYWYRTRYLDPVHGRFTTRDTIGTWGDPANLGNGYAYVGNNPWTFVDPFGRTITFGDPGTNKDFVKDAKDAVEKLKELDPKIKEMIEGLEKSEKEHKIVPSAGGNGNIHENENDAKRDRDGNPGSGSGSTTRWNPRRAKKNRKDRHQRNPIVGLCHELSHAYDADTGTHNKRTSPHGVMIAEEIAVRRENRIRRVLPNHEIRRTYRTRDDQRVRPVRDPEGDPQIPPPGVDGDPQENTDKQD